MPNTVTATGASGVKYTLQIDPIGAAYKRLGGVYIFLKPAPNGKWDPVYIGEAGDLYQRLNAGLKSHQAWSCIASKGATHIATMAAPRDDERLRIETDLRHGHNTPCNRQ